MPKMVKINSKDINVIGTCLVGVITSSYENIVGKLGDPTDTYDNYKSDAEWDIEFEDGTIATIYNWKDGRNYNGESGLATEDITEWHIGGKAGDAVVEWIDDYLNNSWPVFDDIRQEAQT